MSIGFAVGIVVAFLLGQFLHSWLRAQAVVTSSLNGITTYRQYVERNGPVLCIRVFFAWIGMAAWHSYGPVIFSLLTPYIPDALHFIAGKSIPLEPMTAGLYGYFADSIIDGCLSLISRWVPGLKNEVPPAPSVIGTITQTTTIKGTIVGTPEEPVETTTVEVKDTPIKTS